MKLVMVGDVMLGRMVNQMLWRARASYPWGDTLPVFQAADWRICNLECAISDSGEPWSLTPKAFHFRSDAKNIASLEAASIDAVALANNHTLDFGYEALFEMFRLLDGAGIRYAGAGANLEQAASPAISTVKGIPIGVVSFTDNQPEWEARADCPGVLYCPIDVSDERAQLLFRTVRTARAHCDFLIVAAHWGPNWGYQPLAGHVRFGHALIDSGADVIFGHSGHVFQGIELYQGHPIIYCAGNFIDDYAVDEVERNDESFVFTLEVGGGRVTVMRLYPTEIAECQARLARDARAEEIARKMARLCDDFGTPARWLGAEGILEVSGFRT